MRTRIKDIYIMKKMIILAISVLFSVFALPVNAADNGKSIAIIDYTFDTTRPEINGKVIADVCFSVTRICVNAPTTNIYSNESYSHGTIMATVASKIDPTAKIILIRVGNINPKTFTLSSITTTEFDNVLIPAFDWIAQNATKYNIAAVSTSMSHTSFNKIGSYCPIKQSAVYKGTLQDRIVKLQSIGIASVFSAGNTYDNARASYPACITQSIAIGATELTEPTGINPVSLKSAKGPDVDYYALGTYELGFTRMTGQTSPAAAAFASYWTKKYKNNYQDTVNFINTSLSQSYFGLTKTYTSQFVNVLN